MKVAIVIPARWNSTRFPGKPLAKICGKEVIKYVWEKASLSKLAQDVIVATDNKKIKKFCDNSGIKTLMTSKNNKTGTDRICEVSKKINFDIYCNVQGDEPLIDPINIDKVISCLKKNFNKGYEIATGYSEVRNLKKFIKYNDIKTTVFLEKTGNPNKAFIFYRGTQIESLKSKENKPLKHIGLYAYTKSALKRFHNYKMSPSEISESLEQMRFVENKEKILCVKIKDSFFAVDYPNDIKKIEKFLKKSN